MQSVSSRIWTRIVVSNSYDDNHYTTGTMLYIRNYTLFKNNKRWFFCLEYEAFILPGTILTVVITQGREEIS